MNGLKPAPVFGSQLSLSFVGLSCPQEGWCVAVGSYASSGGSGALVETLSGGTWKAANLPAPVDGGFVRLNLSCPEKGWCVAVPGYINEGGVEQDFVETLSGGTWKAATFPTSSLHPAAGLRPSVRLNSLSCPDKGWCVAVGSYTTSGGSTSAPLVETLSGRRWQAADLPISGLGPGVVTNPNLSVGSVSCPAKGWCVAVGDVAVVSGEPRPLVEMFSNGTWKATIAPMSDTGRVEAVPLYNIACPEKGWCVAVGASLYSITGPRHIGLLALIETLSQGTWEAASVPTGGPFSAVSCPVKGWCGAVAYANENENQLRLIETLSQGTWETAATAPAGSSFSAVSCPVKGWCAATGGSLTSGRWQPVVETLSGIEQLSD
jgi:hypothetical protein